MKILAIIVGLVVLAVFLWWLINEPEQDKGYLTESEYDEYLWLSDALDVRTHSWKEAQRYRELLAKREGR